MDHYADLLMDKIVNSLYRGLQILRAFSSEQPKLRLTDIIRKTGLPKSTVIRLLKTLKSLNYVRYDPNDRRYYLGTEVMSLGVAVLSSLSVRETALPYMEELSRASTQNINLTILDGSEVVFIERIKTRMILNLDNPIGSRLSSYRTSCGKAIMAFLTQEKLAEVLEQILKEKGSTDYIGPGGAWLLEDLRRIREKGYALVDEELIPGLRAISAPITDHRGHVEAAINIAFLGQMFSEEELIEKYVPMVVETANAISAARGSANYHA